MATFWRCRKCVMSTVQKLWMLETGENGLRYFMLCKATRVQLLRKFSRHVENLLFFKLIMTVWNFFSLFRSFRWQVGHHCMSLRWTAVLHVQSQWSCIFQRENVGNWRTSKVAFFFSFFIFLKNWIVRNKSRNEIKSRSCTVQIAGYYFFGFSHKFFSFRSCPIGPDFHSDFEDDFFFVNFVSFKKSVAKNMHVKLSHPDSFLSLIRVRRGDSSRNCA